MCFVNFTREPIIETILSPKDGYKLCIKNSKVADSEELFVDVIEVVSFGHAFFFRGQERPKPFLVPVSDYEVFEVKETRVVLKNIAHDRNIKIGGGREAFVRPPKEQTLDRVEEDPKEQDEQKEAAAPADGVVEGKSDRKRDRRRNRRRRLAEERRDGGDKDKSETASKDEDSEESPVEEVKMQTPIFSHLLAPPTVLISERLGRLKEIEREKEREKEVAEAAAGSFCSNESAAECSSDSAENCSEISKEDSFFS